MFTIQQDVTIARPVDQVFAFLADPANIPRWRPDVVETRSGGPLQAGSEFEEISISADGKRRRSAWECLRPTRRWRWRRSPASASDRPNATPCQAATATRPCPSA